MNLPKYNYENIFLKSEVYRAVKDLDSFKRAILLGLERKPAVFTRKLVAISLRFEHDMTYESIGKILGVSLNRARQIILSGLRDIRSFYKILGAGEETKAKSPEIKSNPEIMKEKICKVTDNARTLNCLRSKGISTIEEVIEFGRDNLLLISNFGKKSLRDLEADIKRRFNFDDFKIN